MSERRTDPSWEDLDQGLLIGAVVLLAVGALAGLGGSLLAGAAAVKAARSWMHRAELPPTDLAKLKWAQARAAGRGAPPSPRAGEPYPCPDHRALTAPPLRPAPWPPGASGGRRPFARGG
jgi:hypothetical protein